jgi:hypothetical protein
VHSWPVTWPYFDQLRIDLDLPGIERRLPWQDECLSTAEGLHEDLYFSLLELFQLRADLPVGDRTAQPGQSTTSFQGRTIEGRIFPGTGRGVVITGRQHGNETTGVVGALRAAPMDGTAIDPG